MHLGKGSPSKISSKEIKYAERFFLLKFMKHAFLARVSDFLYTIFPFKKISINLKIYFLKDVSELLASHLVSIQIFLL